MIPYEVLGIDPYPVINFFAFIVVLVYNFLVFRKQPVLSSRAKWLASYSKINRSFRFFNEKKTRIIEFLVVCSIQFFGGLFCDVKFGNLTTNGADNYFGLIYFGPVMFFAYLWLAGFSPLKELDLLTPSYVLSLMVFKVACFFAGCCYGIPWEHGLYNIAHHERQVPVQAIEFFVAFLIFLVLHFYVKKSKRVGTVAPLYLILYSTTRFCTEFLRADFPQLAGPFTTYHFQCMIGVGAGVIELVVALLFGNRFSAWAEAKNTQWEQKHVRPEPVIQHH